MAKKTKHKKDNKNQEKQTLFSSKFYQFVSISLVLCFFVFGVIHILNYYENAPNETYSYIENDIYLPQYMKDLLKSPPKSLYPEEKYHRFPSGDIILTWEARGPISRMIVVFVSGYAIALVMFSAIFNVVRSWLIGIFGFMLFIGTFFFFAPDTDYGYLLAFLGFLVGGILVWRFNR